MDLMSVGWEKCAFDPEQRWTRCWGSKDNAAATTQGLNGKRRKKDRFGFKVATEELALQTQRAIN